MFTDRYGGGAQVNADGAQGTPHKCLSAPARKGKQTGRKEPRTSACLPLPASPARSIAVGKTHPRVIPASVKSIGDEAFAAAHGVVRPKGEFWSFGLDFQEFDAILIMLVFLCG